MFWLLFILLFLLNFWFQYALTFLLWFNFNRGFVEFFWFNLRLLIFWCFDILKPIQKLLVVIRLIPLVISTMLFWSCPEVSRERANPIFELLERSI